MHDFARESQKPTSDFSEMTCSVTRKKSCIACDLCQGRGGPMFSVPEPGGRSQVRGVEDGGVLLLAPHGILRLRACRRSAQDDNLRGSASAQDDNQVAHPFLSQNGEPRNPHKKGFSSLRPMPPSPPQDPRRSMKGDVRRAKGFCRAAFTKRVPHEPKRPAGVSCEQDCLSD